MLTHDDYVTLHVALKARDLNPRIRIVLRQFNRTLGRKIEQNLDNCSVISLSSHVAATYAGVALDHECFYGLQVPDIAGPLVGLSLPQATRPGVAGADLILHGHAHAPLVQPTLLPNGRTALAIRGTGVKDDIRAECWVGSVNLTHRGSSLPLGYAEWEVTLGAVPFRPRDRPGTERHRRRFGRAAREPAQLVQHK